MRCVFFRLEYAFLFLEICCIGGCGFFAFAGGFVRSPLGCVESVFLYYKQQALAEIGFLVASRKSLGWILTVSVVIKAVC